MNLQRIYEKLKIEYQSKGIEVDEKKLHQMAWIKRDRMIFESTNLSNAAASSAGGGRVNVVVNQVLELSLLTESGFPIFTENDQNLILE
jgi:hypothetical protein